jgi:hypothetical protein
MLIRHHGVDVKSRKSIWTLVFWFLLYIQYSVFSNFSWPVSCGIASCSWLLSSSIDLVHALLSSYASGGEGGRKDHEQTLL